MTAAPEPHPCPQCGAPPEDTETCLERFHELLVFDFQDPGYGVVHHLLVAGYRVQHAENVTDEALSFCRAFFRDFAAGRLGASHLEQWAEGRRQAGQAFEGPARVLRRDGPPRAPIPWSRTVFSLDVSSAQAYVQSVEAWARSIAADLEQHPN